MYIRSVEIHNFRCLRHVEIDFDKVTTFIGPNGVGKSTVLRALNWFFNGEKSDLTEDDVYAGAPQNDRRIQVKVTFDQLTATDRIALGEKYASADTDTLTVWRTWENGADKITGKARAFPAFEQVRSAVGAREKRAALEEARQKHPDLDLPKWTTIAATEEAMNQWERCHEELLEDARVSDTHFFGFYGQGKLSGIFDYVLVTADLRASEESVDGRNTIIGMILEKVIDRSAADKELQSLADDMSARYEAITKNYLTRQLDELAADLSMEVQQFAARRQVQLRAASAQLKPPQTRVAVSIRDEMVETTVERQGHGFQRALLISSLKLLADKGAANKDEGVICLAIEEPELFQHPTQARVFSTVLRDLAQAESNKLQVTYATHSPYFIEPRYFDQIRRVNRMQRPDAEHPEAKVHHASMDRVCQRLLGYVADKAIKSRWHQVCLKSLSEAFFANAVVLVEGDQDKAILEGVAAQTRSLAADGIAVAAANGKGYLFLPHAILSELDIPTLVVFDNDAGCRGRMTKDGKKEEDIAATEQNDRKINRKLLRYFGEQETDYPVGLLASGRLIGVQDTLETVVQVDWPEWQTKLDRIIAEGRGVEGKNAATYALAADECTSSPSGTLANIAQSARSLVLL